MKKKNTYLVDDEIDLADFIKSLWRGKILILTISIICGLAGYLYASFQPQMFKTEIQLKNPPPQLFESYSLIFNNNNNSKTLAAQFISDYKLNFFSLDNLQSFVEESRELDDFKAYLKSRNFSVKKYFANKISEVREKNLIIPNKYSLVFTKEINGDIFLNNYVQFIKKKTVLEIKEFLKTLIESRIILYEVSLEKAKLINLENPVLMPMDSKYQVVNEPDELFYKGSKIISLEIISLKRLLTKLEKDQFNFAIVSDKAFKSPVETMSNLSHILYGLMLGIFLSLGIIFFKSILKK